MKITISYSVCDPKIEKVEQILPRIEELLSVVSSEIMINNDIKEYIDSSNLVNKSYEEAMVDLYITNNDEIQSLNLEYRGKDSATDVLSFAMQEADESIVLPVLHLGEIIISIDKLEEQANSNSHSTEHEFVYLLTHGILHLFGMHHDSDETYQKVITIQKDIMNKVLS